jgi:hypothetical protein
VLHRRQGNNFAHHAPDARPPDACTHQDFIGFDAAFVGDDGFDLPIYHLDIHHGGVTVEGCRSCFDRIVSKGFRGAKGFGDTVRGDVVGPENLGFVDQGHFGLDFFGREQRRIVNAPRFRPAQLTPQFSHPFLGVGDFDAADGIKGGAFVGAELAVQFDGVLR